MPVEPRAGDPFDNLRAGSEDSRQGCRRYFAAKETLAQDDVLTEPASRD
jgi:hypothetical protein